MVTGPTSGIGRATALKLASSKRVTILVGRHQERLDKVKEEIGSKGKVDIILCDMSDITSCRCGADELLRLCKANNYILRGILNNAGVSQAVPTSSAQGWDTTFATNFLGQIAWTERLIPHLSEGVQLLFVTSKVEDPEQPLPKKAGMRGGRFLSVESSAKGIWDMSGKDGGPSKLPGANAYATSKQCLLAAVKLLARDQPALRINAVEPGWLPGTGLGRDAGFFLSFVARNLLAPVASHIDGGSTVPKTADLLTRLLVDKKNAGTGLYFNEKGKMMQPSALVQDESHQKLVMDQAREMLGKV